MAWRMCRMVSEKSSEACHFPLARLRTSRSSSAASLRRSDLSGQIGA
jgi:hypothetical protein